MQSDTIRREIEEKFGVVMPFFEPAFRTPEILVPLWDHVRLGYLENPLPPVLKEKVASRLCLYSPVPYPLVWHSCELGRHGVPEREILDLLEAGLDPAATLLFLRQQEMPAEGERNPRLEDAIALATEAIYIHRPESDQLQRELRRLFGVNACNQWAALLACMEASFRWEELHPEISIELDTRIRDHGADILRRNPGLTAHLERWQERLSRRSYLGEWMGTVEPVFAGARKVRERLAFAAGGIALAVALMGLCLLFLAEPPRFAAGLSLLFSSGSLGLWCGGNLVRRRRRLAAILGAFGAAFSALLFLPAFWSPLAGTILLLIGLSLALMECFWRGCFRPGEFLALAGGALAYFSVLAGAGGLGQLAEFSIHVDPFLAVAAVLLGVGAIIVRPTSRTLAMIGSTTPTGRFVRRMVLMIFLIPLGFAGLGMWAGWFALSEGAPAVLLVVLLLLAGVALGMAREALRAEHRRQQVEALLRSRELDFRATFDEAAVGMAHMTFDGRWIRVNDKLCEILGYTRAELTERTFQDVTHPDDLPASLEMSKALIAGEISQYTLEKRYIRKDGQVIWGRLTIKMLFGPEGERRYAIVIVEEITKRKKAEEELARQKANLEAASQAKDRLLSMVSHELRTPLTPMLAALDGLRAADEEQERLLELVRRNVEHEICLVDDLLDLTRLTHGKLRLTRVPLDLHALIREVFGSVHGTLEAKGISSRLFLSAPRHFVRGDASRLRQVLLNLLDNARKFTPAGGRITIATSLHGEAIVTRVTDTGAGITPQAVARIFEAFEQGDTSTQRRYGGLGLGLTITKGLIEGHRGRVGVESLGPGRGSTFFFELPLLKANPALAERPTPPPRAAGAAAARRILLVEDHEDTRSTLQRLLERRGHAVQAVGGVIPALEAARRSHFDLLISDLGLPDGSGLELPNAIASACGHRVPSIALSGYASDEEVMLTIRAGYLRHLTKPVDFSRLLEAIAQGSAD